MATAISLASRIHLLLQPALGRRFAGRWPIVVPQEAVLDSGDRQTVFIAHPGGYFEPRQITIGPQVDGKVVVLSGLKPGETIVTSGNFLVDSESQLKNAMGGMQH